MLSDRIGRKKALAIGSVATLLMLFVYFQILDTKSFLPMLAAMGFFLGFTQFQSGISRLRSPRRSRPTCAIPARHLPYTGANLIAGGPHARTRRMALFDQQRLAVGRGRGYASRSTSSRSLRFLAPRKRSAST